MTDTRPPDTGWQAIRGMPEFRRLLELRATSQFGDGLFQAGLAGAILFGTERAATPTEIALSFAVTFLPYSLLGPFAGPLLDRWIAGWCWSARTSAGWRWCWWSAPHWRSVPTIWCCCPVR